MGNGMPAGHEGESPRINITDARGRLVGQYSVTSMAEDAPATLPAYELHVYDLTGSSVAMLSMSSTGYGNIRNAAGEDVQFEGNRMLPLSFAVQAAGALLENAHKPPEQLAIAFMDKVNQVAEGKHKPGRGIVWPENPQDN